MATPRGVSTGPVAEWSIREQLILASAVQRSEDQNWVSVSRAVKPLVEDARPTDYFSQKNCALQYSTMLDKAGTTKRKRSSDGSAEVGETTGQQIVRQLAKKQINELNNSLGDIKQEHAVLKKEIEMLESGELDSDLPAIWEKLQVELSSRASSGKLASASSTSVTAENHEKPTKLVSPSQPNPPSTKASNVSLSTQGSVKSSSEKIDAANAKPFLPIVAASTEIRYPSTKLLSTSKEDLYNSKPMHTPHPSTQSTLQQLSSDIHVIVQQPNTALTGNNNDHSKHPLMPTKPVSSSTATAVADAQVVVSPKLNSGAAIAITSAPATSQEAMPPLIQKGIPPTKPSVSYPTVPAVTIVSTPAAKQFEDLPTISAAVKSPVQEVASTRLETAVASSKVSMLPQLSMESQSTRTHSISLPSTDKYGTTSQVSRVGPTASTQAKLSAVSVLPFDATTQLKHVAATGDDVTTNKVEATIQDAKSPPVSQRAALSGIEPVNGNQLKSQTVSSPVCDKESDAKSQQTQELSASATAKPITMAVDKQDSTPISSGSSGAESPAMKGASVVSPDNTVLQATREASRSPTGDLSPEKMDIHTESQDPPLQSEQITSRSVSPLVEPQKTGEEEMVEGEEPTTVKTHKRIARAMLRKPMSRKRRLIDDEGQSVESTDTEEEPISTRTSAAPSPAPSQSEMDTETVQARKQWKKAIMLVWRHAAQHKYANLFLHPVREEDAPGYRDVILRPMDLNTIKRKVESGVTRTDTEFQRDMLLMFQNAFMYNSSDHDVFFMAQEMKSDVMESIQDYLATQAQLQLMENQHTPQQKTLRSREGRTREIHDESIFSPAKKRKTRADD